MLEVAIEPVAIVALPLIVRSMDGTLLRRVGRRGWPVVRQVLGWLSILVGLLGLILPGPGVPFLMAGMALVGRRHPVLRRVVVVLKLRVRAWARQPGLPGYVGKRGQQVIGEQRRVVRHAQTWLSRSPRRHPTAERRPDTATDGEEGRR